MLNRGALGPNMLIVASCALSMFRVKISILFSRHYDIGTILDDCSLVVAQDMPGTKWF